MINSDNIFNALKANVNGKKLAGCSVTTTKRKKKNHRETRGFLIAVSRIDTADS